MLCTAVSSRKQCSCSTSALGSITPQKPVTNGPVPYSQAGHWAHSMHGVLLLQQEMHSLTVESLNYMFVNRINFEMDAGRNPWQDVQVSSRGLQELYLTGCAHPARWWMHARQLVQLGWGFGPPSLGSTRN